MKTVLNLTALLLCGVGVAAAQTDSVRVEREVYLMGTLLRAEVAAADRVQGIDALEKVFSEIRRLEDVISSWSPDSEIGRLAGSAVETEVVVSAELAGLLLEAEKWWRETAGAFDPAVGALVEAWDLRGPGRRPTPGTLADALSRSGMERYSICADGRVRVSAEASWIDTGGFGKGAALRAAPDLLARHGVGSGLLDFGGQILTVGDSPEADGRWTIEVADPETRSGGVVRVQVPGGYSIATSSQSERFVVVSGERIGHVLDPRTGQPVRAWGSVTVIAENPMVADILATALLVMGPEEGRRWAANRNEAALFLEVGDDGTTRRSWNRAFEPFLNKDN